MARRKTTRKRTATRSTAKRRKTASRRKKGSDKLINFLAPMFLMVCIVGCIGLVLVLGFRSVAASSFFEIENVEALGLENVKEESVMTAVRTERDGISVFDTNLDAIKKRIEKIVYVKHVSVSRQLPGTIRVIVDERVPVALVQSGGDLRRVDEEGRLLDIVTKRKPQDPAFIMLGWEEEVESEAAARNKKRLKIYREVANEWNKFDLAERVLAVDLVSPSTVKAIISDSGERITLTLGASDFGVRLKEGIKHSVGNGKKISRIDMGSASPVIAYRD